MKRYFVFVFATYYPSGGMDDFIGDVDEIDEGIELIEKEISTYSDNSNTMETIDWNYHHAIIWDSETREAVFTK